MVLPSGDQAGSRSAQDAVPHSTVLVVWLTTSRIVIRLAMNGGSTRLSLDVYAMNLPSGDQVGFSSLNVVGPGCTTGSRPSASAIATRGSLCTKSNEYARWLPSAEYAGGPSIRSPPPMGELRLVR